MRILITNDDGINAPGIRMLAEWAKTLGEVTVVAPKVEQSGMSHAIQFVEPIEIKKVPFMDGVEAWSMDSTPADCIRFGITGLKRKYDLVLSGINHGVNVGADVVYSGTVAAIFEAVRLRHKAIAFSSFFQSQAIAAKHLNQAYQYLIDNNLFEENPIYNINIPNEPIGVKMTYQGSDYFSDDFVKTDGEDMYLQVGEQIADECPEDMNRDTVAVHAGYITVTPLMATRTNMQVFEKYKTK
jgi:5'-nucleotidase